MMGTMMSPVIRPTSVVRCDAGRIIVDGVAFDVESDFAQALCDAWWLSRVDPDDGAVAGDDGSMVSWSGTEVALDGGESSIRFECGCAHRAIGLLSNAWNVSAGAWPSPTAQCGA